MIANEDYGKHIEWKYKKEVSKYFSPIYRENSNVPRAISGLKSLDIKMVDWVKENREYSDMSL